MPQAPWSASAVEARAVTALLPYAGNARTHSAEQVAQIAASILEFGFVAPVLVDERGEVIAGHGRLQAAKSLGLETVPTITRAGLTDAQKAAYRLADNRIALNAGWDEALLAAEVAKLQEIGGIDLALTGFDAGELDRLLAGMEPVATDPGNGPLASPTVASSDGPGNDAPTEDPADADPEPPRQAVTRPGDLWLLGEHRLLCGDSTDVASVARVMGDDRAALLFTSPPYGNQRDYTTGGGTDWDALMQGVFQHLDVAMRPDGQVLVNLGLIHRDNEWQPYWAGWLDWMRARDWRRFGLYTWDQGPGLPGDWNGRLAPAFELVFHFNRQARQANKIVPCKWAGTPNKGSGLRAADGTISEYQHAGLPVQDFRIPDNVLRLTRHKGRGIETEHPAVFPVVLPEFLMRAYTDESDVVFEPFGGSGTTILAGQRSSRRVRAIELAPAYVDLAIARWRMLHPDLPVTLADDGREYDAVPGAFLYDERVRDAVALTAVTPTAAGMPVANLRDPQPRLRARFTGGAASVLVDFGTATPVEAVALISTNLSTNATVRWRLGTLEVPNAAHDSGTLPAHTGDEANGNVVLIRNGAATARYLLVDVADASLPAIDIGLLVAGPLWRVGRGMAYGVREGRLILDQRDRNPLTGAEFVVPALANPRFAAFTLPALSRAEVADAHRDLVRRLGAARDALWIPETGDTRAETNRRAIWGAVNQPGEEAAAARGNFPLLSRAFRIVERL